VEYFKQTSEFQMKIKANTVSFVYSYKFDRHGVEYESEYRGNKSNYYLTTCTKMSITEVVVKQ